MKGKTSCQVSSVLFAITGYLDLALNLINTNYYLILKACNLQSCQLFFAILFFLANSFSLNDKLMGLKI